MKVAAEADERWRWPAAPPMPPLEVRRGELLAGRLDRWLLRIADGHMVFTGEWLPVGLPEPAGLALGIRVGDRWLEARVTHFDGRKVRMLVPL